MRKLHLHFSKTYLSIVILFIFSFLGNIFNYQFKIIDNIMKELVVVV